MREALDRVAGPGFVHVSLDLDALDPEVAPGVGTPVPRRPHLPRGAPRLRADRRVGHRRLVRARRVEPDPRPREHDGAAPRSSSSRARSARRSSRGGTCPPVSAVGRRRCGRRRGRRASRRPRRTPRGSASARSPQRVGLRRREPLEQQRQHARGVLRSSPTTRRASRPPTSRAPPRRPRSRALRDSTTARSRSGSASRNGPGASGSGGSVSPSSSAARPGAVIHGLSRGLAQTASTTRPPGRVTRAISAAGPLHVGDEHDPEAAEDAVDRVVGERQRRRRPRRRSGRPRGRARRRAGGRRRPSRARRRSRSARRRAGSVAAREARLAGAGRQLEHALPGLRLEQLDHPRRERRRRAREQIAPAAPSPAATLRQASTCSAAASSMRPRP